MPCITHDSPPTPRERVLLDEIERLTLELSQRNASLDGMRSRATKERDLLSPLQEVVDVLTAQLREREAMLCGVLAALADIDDAAHMRLTSDNLPLKILSDAMPVWYDGGKSGVGWEEIDRWWNLHQTKDRLRLEQQVQERERKRQEILSRLTPEEREILGIKE